MGVAKRWEFDESQVMSKPRKGIGCRRSVGRIYFGVGLFVGVLLWLVLFPWIARFPHVQSRIERQESASINPSAVFYTEHPMHLETYRKLQDKLTP